MRQRSLLVTTIALLFVACNGGTDSTIASTESSTTESSTTESSASESSTTAGSTTAGSTTEGSTTSTTTQASDISSSTTVETSTVGSSSTTSDTGNQGCFSETYCFTPPEGVVCEQCEDDAKCDELKSETYDVAFEQASQECSCRECGGGACGELPYPLYTEGDECCFMYVGTC